MKHRAIIIAVCLLAGAIINVAVAWGCAWKREHGSKRPQGATQAHRWAVIAVDESRLGWGTIGWLVVLRRAFGETEIEQDSFAQMSQHIAADDLLLQLPRWSSLHGCAGTLAGREALDDQSLTHTVREFASGWPMRCLKYVERAIVWHGGSQGVQFWQRMVQPVGAWQVRRATLGSTGDDAMLPCMPIWSGFALNTIAYAALCWLIVTGPQRIRRVIRRFHRRCENCGYDLRGAAHERCPECGSIASLRVSKKIVPCVP